MSENFYLKFFFKKSRKQKIERYFDHFLIYDSIQHTIDVNEFNFLLRLSN